MIDKSTLATDVASRVGCYGVGTWLVELAAGLNLKAEALMPQNVSAPNLIDLPESGLCLTLSHRENLTNEFTGLDRWLISDIAITQNWSLPWPFNLPVDTATVESVSTLLGSNTSGLQGRNIEKGDLRQTYFLTDGRAVGITWRVGLVGFSAMHICRLGIPLDFAVQLRSQII
jgi:hypothetical protein